MHVTPRSYLTAGIAALGVGAIALSPIQPLPDHNAPAQQKAVAHLAVNLASTIDPITPWVDTFKTAFANIQTLGKLNEQNPFPLAKTVGANIGTYFSELTNGQGNLIPGQIWNNVQTFFQAPWDPGSGIDVPYASGPEFLSFGDYVSDYFPPSGQAPSGVATFFVGAAVGQWAAGCEDDDSCTFKPLIPIINFLNTPYSGQLVALVGTLISPLVQAVKSFTAVGEFFQAGDVIGAINELINIPANMTNASLNGAGFLDLTGIVDSIVPNSPLTRIGVNLGGLLNVMPQDKGWGEFGFTPPTEWSGGVGTDSLSVGEPGAFDYAQGIPNGLLGANIGLGQFLADKLLVTPPAPGQAVTPAAAAKAAAAVEAPAAAPVEAPAAVNAPVEDSEAPTLAAEPAPLAVPKAAAEPDPEPVSTPAPSRARGIANSNNSAAQNDSSDNAPAHRGGRGR